MKLLKNGKMTTIWSHPLKTGHEMKNTFFQNESLIMLNNFYHYEQRLKSSWGAKKRRLSQKYTKNGKMTAIWRHTSKTGHDMFSKCFAHHAGQLLPWSTLLKNQVLVTKKGIKSKITKNRKMTATLFQLKFAPL